MDMMTPQQIFDRVSVHLLTQMKQAQQDEQESGGYECRYRTYHQPPLMCAVGCLIQDHVYDTRMEGESARGLLSQGRFRNAMITSGIPNDELTGGLLSALQRTHDQHAPRFWYDELVAVANKFSLTVNFSRSA